MQYDHDMPCSPWQQWSQAVKVRGEKKGGEAERTVKGNRERERERERKKRREREIEEVYYTL